MGPKLAGAMPLKYCSSKLGAYVINIARELTIFLCGETVTGVRISTFWEQKYLSKLVCVWSMYIT